MNQDEFVQKVADSHKEWTWKLVGEGAKQLRATNRWTGQAFCPIVALAGVTGYDSVIKNAERLGLSEADRVEIQSAADGTLGNPVLRRRLLAVAGV